MELLRTFLMSDKSDVIFQSGFSTPLTKVSLQDVPALVKVVCFHTVLMKVKLS